MGTEVKACGQGRASLVDGFATIDDGEVWLQDVHIPEYAQGTWTNHAPRRKRKLLMHRAEIDRLEQQDQGERADAGPAAPVLQRQPRQGRARPGQGQAVLRQAAGPGRARRPPGDRPGDRPAGSRAVSEPVRRVVTRTLRREDAAVTVGWETGAAGRRPGRPRVGHRGAACRRRRRCAVGRGPRLELLARFTRSSLPAGAPAAPADLRQRQRRARCTGVTAAELLAGPDAVRRPAAPGRRRAVVRGPAPGAAARDRAVAEYRLRRADGSWSWVRDEQVRAPRRRRRGRSRSPARCWTSPTARRTEERAERLQQLTAGLAAALTPEQVAASALLPALSVLEAAGRRADPARQPAPTRRAHRGRLGRLPAPSWSSTGAGCRWTTGTPAGCGGAHRHGRSTWLGRGGPGRFPDDVRAALGPQTQRAWAALPLRAAAR